MERQESAGAGFRQYDFRLPDKFSKEQLRTLHLLHESYARVVSTVLSGQLRATAEVSVGTVEQVTFGEFSRRLSNPGAIAVVSLKPLTGNAVLVLEPGLAIFLVDRVLGGKGAVAPEPYRELTEIEQTVVRRLVASMLEHLRDGWRNVAEITPVVESLETNPMFAQVVGPSEICAVVGFALKIGELRGSISLCFPYLLMEPVLPSLSAFIWFAATRRTNGSSAEARIRSRLEEVTVELVATLGSAYLSLRELLDLGIGDVVPLDRAANDELVIAIDDRPKLQAHPGMHRGRLAVEITRTYQEGNG